MSDVDNKPKINKDDYFKIPKSLFKDSETGRPVPSLSDTYTNPETGNKFVTITLPPHFKTADGQDLSYYKFHTSPKCVREDKFNNNDYSVYMPSTYTNKEGEICKKQVKLVPPQTKVADIDENGDVVKESYVNKDGKQDVVMNADQFKNAADLYIKNRNDYVKEKQAERAAEKGGLEADRVSLDEEINGAQSASKELAGNQEKNDHDLDRGTEKIA